MKLVLLLAGFLLAACATKPRIDDSSYGASIGIVNHTDKFIYSAAVDGAGGANMAARGAGYGNVCCVRLPTKWRPGMKVLVQWDMPEGSKHLYRETVVEVEQYDEPGTIYLHFFPEDKVRVVVSPYFGGAPKHPIPRPLRPAPKL